MKEKNKLLTHRLIWIILTLLVIFIPIVANITQPALAIVEDNAYITNYYTYLNETVLKMDITFNRHVNGGNVSIEFYDEYNNYLSTKTEYFYGYNEKTIEDSYITVYGKATQYKIRYYSVEPSFILGQLYAFLIPAILMLIESLLVSYKEYEYNGKIISVYAGYFHHTLRINGEKFDEHNTLLAFTPIKLTTKLDQTTDIEATITLTNRISLKINNKLLEPIKHAPLQSNKKRKS